MRKQILLDSFDSRMIQLYHLLGGASVMANARQTWLFLIHQLPPKPDYLRVKIRRRLQKIGAIAVKNTVYALPNRDDKREDFVWVLKEIIKDGGEGLICESTLIDGLSDRELIGQFNRVCNESYSASIALARRLLQRLERGAPAPEFMRECAGEISRLRQAINETAALDFFDAEEHKNAVAAIARVEAGMKTRTVSKGRTGTKGPSVHAFQKRVWVTRANIFVDRIASAWLIVRFIDKRAAFKFVDEDGYKPREGELRFDTSEGEFTHSGDRCTFEVLCQEFKITEPAIQTLGQIIHDIDLKDDKFGREEAPGIAMALRGFRSKYVKDEQRLTAGLEFFDALYDDLSANPRKKRNG
jgi:hypothetical protein